MARPVILKKKCGNENTNNDDQSASMDPETNNEPSIDFNTGNNDKDTPMDKNKEKCSEDKTINKEHSGDEGDNWLHLESSRDEESINDDKTDKENTSAVISSGDFSVVISSGIISSIDEVTTVNSCLDEANVEYESTEILEYESIEMSELDYLDFIINDYKDGQLELKRFMSKLSERLYPGGSLEVKLKCLKQLIELGDLVTVEILMEVRLNGKS